MESPFVGIGKLFVDVDAFDCDLRIQLDQTFHVRSNGNSGQTRLRFGTPEARVYRKLVDRFIFSFFSLHHNTHCIIVLRSSANVFPSALCAPKSSCMDDATTQAMVQERRKPTLRGHACCSIVQHVVLTSHWPWPEETRKSSFPQTFLQLRQLQQPAPSRRHNNSGYRRSSEGHLQRNPISLSCASHKERQAINDDFEPPPVGDIRVAKVPCEDVR